MKSEGVVRAAYQNLSGYEYKLLVNAPHPVRMEQGRKKKREWADKLKAVPPYVLSLLWILSICSTFKKKLIKTSNSFLEICKDHAQ